MARLLTLLILIVATVVPANAAAAGLPPWHVSATLSLGTDSVAVDCPDASSCWSVESGRLLSSADGGASWTDRTALVPADVVALDALDCLTASLCYLAATRDGGGATLLVLADGAVTEHPVPGPPTLASLSCTPPAHCLATTGTSSYATDDGGTTWRATSLPRTLLGKPAVDCVPQTQVCYLVGNYGLVPTILKSANRGQSWTMQSAPYNDGGIYAIDCPAVTVCYATGADYSDHALVVRTVDGGQQWTFAQVPFHSYPLRSISCPGASTCTAVGQSPGNTPFVFATTDGQHWTDQPIAAIATDQPAQVSCPTTTACAAVASAVAFVTSNSGASWQTVDVPAGLEAPAALTCSTALRCIGAGRDAAGRPFVIVTNDRGTTWAPAALPSGTGRPADVECPSRRTCYLLAIAAVPGTGRDQTQLLTSSDGGRNWHLTATRSATIGALTCPAETTCLASGYGTGGTKAFRITGGGTAWTPLTLPDTTTLVGIACTAVPSCVFLMGTYDGAWTAFTTDDLGTTYSPHAIPAADWFGLDCAGLFCMAGGSDGGSGAIATSSDGGVTWTGATVPPQAQLISEVSCGSPQSCAASTYDFNYYRGGPRIVGTRDGGASWQVFAVPARHEAPIAVACHGSRCRASDYSTAGNPIIVAGAA